jgi:ribosomal protein S18 acetylase RimI-like enzyme
MRDPLSSDTPAGDDCPVPQSKPVDIRPTTDAVRPRVHYRRMGSGDLAFVVAQHLHHFPDGFFARLGPRFLHEYYRAFLTGPSARTTVAEVDGERAGYLVGVTDPARHRDHVVRRHGRALVLRAAVAMMLRPALAVCFVRTRLGLYGRKLLRRRRRGATARPSPGATTPTAVLTHVAIRPAAQSQGIGSDLIRRFQHEVAEAGCERLTLVTASGDDGAGPYYRRRGWTALGERCTPDGLQVTTFERPVGATAQDDERPRSEGTA